MRPTCFAFLLLLVCQSAFSQSKKDQIETLIFQKDSLGRVLEKERQLNSEQVKQLETKISKINSDMALIQKELTQSKKVLAEKEQEILGHQLDHVLWGDTIRSLREELHQIKSNAIQSENNLLLNGFTTMTFNDLPSWYKENINVWFVINDDRILKEGEEVHYIGGWHPVKGDFFFLNGEILEFKKRERITSKDLISDIFEFKQYSITIDWLTYEGEVHYEGAYLEGKITLVEKNEVKFDSRFWQVGW
jgi:hypothetical protein